MPKSSSIRPSVARLVALGPLPAESADDSSISPYETALRAIERPVSDEEAALLVGLFGPDDCFGLAWTLLHLVESAPHAVIASEPPANANAWLRRLRERARRGALR